MSKKTFQFVEGHVEATYLNDVRGVDFVLTEAEYEGWGSEN